MNLQFFLIIPYYPKVDNLRTIKEVIKLAIMSSRLIRHDLCKEELQQMGAKVIDIQGIMFYVKFYLDDIKISYIYHLNTDNTFFLERIKPYSLAIGDYKTEEDIIEEIKVDIEQFKNAMKSHNFENFIEVDGKITQLARIFEDLYLYYNVKEESVNEIDKELYKLLDMMKEILMYFVTICLLKDVWINKL